MITNPITMAMPMCTFFLILATSASGFVLVLPNMSTVKDVVRAVSADPAAAYAADISPIINSIPTIT